MITKGFSSPGRTGSFSFAWLKIKKGAFFLDADL
jgi:hypothetical protein